MNCFNYFLKTDHETTLEKCVDLTLKNGKEWSFIIFCNINIYLNVQFLMSAFVLNLFYVKNNWITFQCLLCCIYNLLGSSSTAPKMQWQSHITDGWNRLWVRLPSCSYLNCDPLGLLGIKLPLTLCKMTQENVQWEHSFCLHLSYKVAIYARLRSRTTNLHS